MHSKASPDDSFFPLQSIRSYATEAPKSGSKAPLLAGLAIAGAAGGYYFLQSGAPAVPAVVKEPTKTFIGGDQGWVDLKLESVDIVNHNTKKFRFALPEADAVSGLEVACE